MKTKRKGFTLVELLVVIATLAVLASVSIVAYTSFTKKANLSNDQTMIKMVNDNLMGEAVFDQPTSAKDAIEDLYTQGFSSEKLIPFSKGYHYAYSLENNKFYLLDDKDNVVYPETTVDKAKLWGLYRDEQTDKISGVTQYVAMKVINNQTNFNNVFADGTNYKLDLNNNYIAISGKNNVTVLNGSVKPGSGFTVDKTNNTVTELTKYENTTPLTSTNKDMYFEVKTGATLVKYPTEPVEVLTISNCTFDGNSTTNSAYLCDIPENIKEVVIENCTFVNHNKWSLTIGTENAARSVKYTLRNNKFVNSSRGVNFKGYFDEGTVVEGNEFTLNNTNKSNAIQIANLNKAVEAIYTTYKTPAITVRNNKMYTGNAFVVTHSTLVGKAKTPTEPAIKYDWVDANNLDKFIAFENNQLLDSRIAKVIPDPEAQEEVGTITGAVTQLQTYVDKLLTLFK